MCLRINVADYGKAGRFYALHRNNLASALWKDYKIQQTFLTGGNPFVLNYERLMTIAELIKKYFSEKFFGKSDDRMLCKNNRYFIKDGFGIKRVEESRI